MNCEQLRARLDAYMDGELSDVELREMEAHAETCADCGRELASAKLLREVLKELPEEVDVPLDVQASWRRAVREEAERTEASDSAAPRKPKRRWLRAVYAAAAIMVLVIGASAMLREAPGDTVQLATELEAVTIEDVSTEDVAPRAALPTGAVVAQDGDVKVSAIAQSEVYAAWKKYATLDVAAACASVEALVEEYSGSCVCSSEEETSQASDVVYRIELSREYLDDFLSAVSHIGVEQDSETMDPKGDVAVVYIQIDRTDSE